MSEFSNGHLLWRGFQSVGEAHISTAGLSGELQTRGESHRVLEIIPTADGALALVLTSGTMTPKGWRSSLRSSEVMEAIYSLGTGGATPSKQTTRKLWVSELESSEDVVFALDRLLNFGGEVADCLLRRSGSPGGTVFFWGEPSMVTELRAAWERKPPFVGEISFSGDYRRFWL